MKKIMAIHAGVLIGSVYTAIYLYDMWITIRPSHGFIATPLK